MTLQEAQELYDIAQAQYLELTKKDLRPDKISYRDDLVDVQTIRDRAYISLLETKLETLSDLFPQYNKSLRVQATALAKVAGLTPEQTETNSPELKAISDSYYDAVLVRVKLNTQIESILGIEGDSRYAPWGPQ